MSKNIIICLDGTGNKIEENLSNVLKLYRILDKNDKQIVYYDQGVGTFGQQDTWGVLSQKIKTFWGKLTGYGLDKNVLEAYKFIVTHYKSDKNEQDKLFIFGFSRGAHTARVLAGMIYMMGVLRPDQVNLAGAALTAYKRAGTKSGKKNALYFARITATKSGHRKNTAIEFMGVWDTVSSVIIPDAARFFLPGIERLRLTRDNPAVRIFRHAMAIDEKRRMFRVDKWTDGQYFKPNPRSTGEPVPQNSKQVWFAGDHSDVGGGYKRAESAIAQYPLKWMITEASSAGLEINLRMFKHVANGEPYSSNSMHNYPKPTTTEKPHDSMKLLWPLLEYFPKFKKNLEWRDRKVWFGRFYFPQKEPRFIEADAIIHDSVYQRMENCREYNPENVPERNPQ